MSYKSKHDVVRNFVHQQYTFDSTDSIRFLKSHCLIGSNFKAVEMQNVRTSRRYVFMISTGRKRMKSRAIRLDQCRHIRYESNIQSARHVGPSQILRNPSAIFQFIGPKNFKKIFLLKLYLVALFVMLRINILSILYRNSSFIGSR